MEYVIGGIDLHSNNLVIGLIDESGQRLKHGKIDCDLGKVLAFFGSIQRAAQIGGGGVDVQLVLAGGRVERGRAGGEAGEPGGD